MAMRGLPGVTAVLVHAVPAAEGPTLLMARLALQLAAILIAACLGGMLVRRWLRGPAVLGELLAGMLIGPYGLGGVSVAGWGPLFPLPETGWPVSFELYGIAVVASIVLLFLSGLQTDLTILARFSLAGMNVGVGGLVVSFALGAAVTVWCGMAPGILDPQALFMGAVATATSVGITARVLTEQRKMGSPEGVTIMAGAVFDDVIGIVLLAVVVGMAHAQQDGAPLDWPALVRLGAKIFGFWILLTGGGLLLARRIGALLKRLRSPRAMAAVGLGLALLVAGLSEHAGLAMIIGAYITGLALSRTDLVDELQERLSGVYDLLIPVFFCVSGMLVNVPALRGVLWGGLLYAATGILTKVLGCGLPARLSGFSTRGALRIGLGMAPRGEVCLVVAGVGLAAGAIGPELFGVAVMLMFVSTLVAAPLISTAFRGPPGTARAGRNLKHDSETWTMDLPSPSLADFLATRIARAFRQEEFFVRRLPGEPLTYHIRKDDMAFILIREASRLTLHEPLRYRLVGRMIILEEILALQDLLASVRAMKDPRQMGSELLNGLFTQPAAREPEPPTPGEATDDP